MMMSYWQDSEPRVELPQAALDALESRIAVLGPDGMIRAVNRAWRLFAQEAGAAEATVLGTGLDYLAVCDRAAQAGEALAREAGDGIRAVLAGHRPAFCLDYPCDGPDRRHWFALLVTPVAGGGAVLLHEDITLRKEVELALKRKEPSEGDLGGQPSDAPYLLLFKASPQPMWVYDEATLCILDVNDAAVFQYGYTREEFLRLDIKALRPEAEVPLLLEHLQGARLVYSPSGEWRHRKKDGSVIFVDVSAHSTVFQGREARLVMATDVSERKRAEEALRQSEARYRTLAAHIPDCDLYLFDRSMRFVLADGTELERLGLSKEAIAGKRPRELFGADTAAELERLYEETLAGRQATVELSFRGQFYSIRTVPITGQGEHYAGMALMQNITARRRQEERLERLSRLHGELVDFFDESLRRGFDASFYARLLDRAVRLIPGAEAGSLLVRDPVGRYRFVAAVGYDLSGLAQVTLEAHELFGDHTVLEPQIVMGQPEREIDDTRRALLERHGRLDEICASLVAPIAFEGRVVAFLSLNSFTPGRGFASEALEMARAFAQPVAVLFQRRALEAELRARQQELERLANYDVLTGLPNRMLFYDRLGEALKYAKRSGEAVGVIYLDLDGFKRVNDTWGHEAGDRLLVAVAERLSLCVRENDTVARLGGDEFVFILNGLKSPEHAPLVAKKILTSLARPFALEGQAVRVTASIGIAAYPSDAQDAETLIRRADTAMYRVKEAGRNGFTVFAPA